MLRTDFSYHLPDERIAQSAVEPRDHSRLMHLDRTTKTIDHHHFYNLPELLQPGDLLVLNDTKVLPVRLQVTKPTGGKAEVLLTRRLTESPDGDLWEALTKPGLKLGQTASTTLHNGHQLNLTVEAVDNDGGMTRQVRVTPGGTAALAALDALGTLPLPPYIHQQPIDPSRYQTVFAQHAGSAAAPTAGLHFTPELLETLKKRGVETAHVTLHVGLGTFLPVKAESLENHPMHAEWYQITEAAANAINTAKREGRRVIAVGTTAMRTLEAAAAQYPNQPLPAHAQETRLFVYPPYQFQICDGIITNFHLPESTLLMLISAFTSAPQTDTQFIDFAHSFLGRAYQTAIEQQYRFYSFGDAMLIT